MEENLLTLLYLGQFVHEFNRATLFTFQGTKLNSLRWREHYSRLWSIHHPRLSASPSKRWKEPSTSFHVRMGRCVSQNNDRTSFHRDGDLGGVKGWETQRKTLSLTLDFEPSLAHSDGIFLVSRPGSGKKGAVCEPVSCAHATVSLAPSLAGERAVWNLNWGLKMNARIIFFFYSLRSFGKKPKKQANRGRCYTQLRLHCMHPSG